MSKKTNNQNNNQQQPTFETFTLNGIAYTGREVVKATKTENTLNIQRVTNSRMVDFERIKTEEEIKKLDKKISQLTTSIEEEEEKVQQLLSKMTGEVREDNPIYETLNSLKALKASKQEVREEKQQHLDDLTSLQSEIGEHSSYSELADNERRIIDLVARSFIKGSLANADFGVGSECLEALHKRAIKLSTASKIKEVTKKDGSISYQSNISDWYKQEFKQLKYDLSEMVKLYFSTSTEEGSGLFKNFSTNISVALVECLISLCTSEIRNDNKKDKNSAIQEYMCKKLVNISLQKFKEQLGMLLSAKFEGTNIEERVEKKQEKKEEESK